MPRRIPIQANRIKMAIIAFEHRKLVARSFLVIRFWSSTVLIVAAIFNRLDFFAMTKFSKDDTNLFFCWWSFNVRAQLVEKARNQITWLARLIYLLALRRLKFVIWFGRFNQKWNFDYVKFSHVFLIREFNRNWKNWDWIIVVNKQKTKLRTERRDELSYKMPATIWMINRVIPP